MITYELAKQLKDAGFPTEGPCSFPWKHQTIERRTPDENLCVYAPTLSELIEACGEDFIGIRKAAGLWFADAAEKHQPLTPFGSTPEEAVAELWLALHHG